MKLVTATILVAMLAVGCRAASPNAAPTVVDTSPPITAILVDYQRSWSPAWDPSSDVVAEFAAALEPAGISMMIPTAAPSSTGSETLSIDVKILDRVPAGSSSGEVVVRRADLSVFMSLTSIPIDGEPICAPLLEEPDGGWSPKVVRGSSGCAMEAESLSYLAWSENRQDFLAEFGTEVGADNLALWLDAWEVVSE